MRHHYNSMGELVGNTPMLKINEMGVKPEVELFAKLELMNPAGSVKDRTGVWMVRDAEERGLLKPGSTIVEATAGNMGLGIAFAALGKGYKVVFVVPGKFSEEKQTLMRALGASIIHTPEEDGMLGAQAKMEELLGQIPGSVALRQFKNQANPQAHYESTAPEIWRDLGGHIDYFVAGAGSGGTFTGIMRYLKERDPAIRGVLADPVGSTMGGGEHAAYAIEGIGNDFVADTMDMGLVDEVIKVNDDQAYGASRELARKEGVFAGSSSGAALFAALQVAERIDHGTVVTLFPDRGDRYFSEHLYE
ncbi:PLP-dependent cysteine synthase family protein [Olsenella porci]|uniref:Cysteine synthase family protein n=1 Tax=Olsenella porci TaxID=2652279 RepID=A0A6N7XNB1_9ACTN|nr:cysteine synthase family protein [Olsenella porci]MST72728.1 cysteine synthase family protein [Olsenella porci]